MKIRETIRGALEKPETLTLIKSLLFKRGITNEDGVMDELVTDVVIELLSTEEYYETKFKHGLGSYIGQCINKVIRLATSNPDALDQHLLYLDTPVGEGVENHDHPTLHDFFDHVVEAHEDCKAELPTFITQPGVASKMTYYLSQLTDTQSECFTLMYVYGHSAQEISDLTGLTVNTVYSAVKDAKRELLVIKASEEAYEAKLGLGGDISQMSGRIISNNDAGNVWADQFWQERHAQPGEVVVIMERGQYVNH